MKSFPRAVNAIAFSPVLWIIDLIFCWGNIYFVVQSRQWQADKHVLCPNMQFFYVELPYELRVLDPNNDSFIGPLASPRVDWQYENMMRHQTFRMSREELERVGKWRDNAVELKHGGYLAALNVYHELRGLNWFKRDFRNPAKATFDTEYERIHVGHCIDLLRHQAQCRSDMTVASWYWKDGRYDKPWARPQSPAHCVDWTVVEKSLEPWNLEYVDGTPELARAPGGGFIMQEELVDTSVYD